MCDEYRMVVRGPGRAAFGPAAGLGPLPGTGGRLSRFRPKRRARPDQARAEPSRDGAGHPYVGAPSHAADPSAASGSFCRGAAFGPGFGLCGAAAFHGGSGGRAVRGGTDGPGDGRSR